MDAYARLQGVSFRGGGGEHNLRIHGTAQLFASRADCAAACSASVDCTGFVLHREVGRARFCTFKRLGALAATNLRPASSKDTYVKRKKDQPPPRLRWNPEPDLLRRLNITSLAARDIESDESAGPRVLAVRGLLSEKEAATLRDFALDCFRREHLTHGGAAVSAARAAAVRFANSP